MEKVELVPADYFRELRREEIFADPTRPLEVDLGCGEGRFLMAMAKQFPERDFLGVERMDGRVAKLKNKIRQSRLTNVRVLRLESGYTVGWLLPAASVSRLHLLCPDPWPKKKHEERRLVVIDEFQRGLRRVLQPGGEFLLKTDDEPYYQVATTAFDALDGFERAAWEKGTFFYPETDFERHWLRLGKPIHRARWMRRVD